MSCPFCKARDVRIDEVDSKRPWRIYDENDLPATWTITYCPFCGVKLPTTEGWQDIRQAARKEYADACVSIAEALAACPDKGSDDKHYAGLLGIEQRAMDLVRSFKAGT